jgi:flagellar hook assembly protein FlgD
VKTEREESVSPAGVFNYPNPFNAETNFIVTLPTKRQWNQGTIRIYDVRGNMIRSIDMAGTLTASWNGRDEQGVTVSTGVYFYHLIIENTVLFHGSMIYLK